jgi:hypothetical protein
VEACSSSSGASKAGTEGAGREEAGREVAGREGAERKGALAVCMQVAAWLQVAWEWRVSLE